jgi:tetratricopeptide (TPR) repeat protein
MSNDSPSKRSGDEAAPETSASAPSPPITSTDAPSSQELTSTAPSATRDTREGFERALDALRPSRRPDGTGRSSDPARPGDAHDDRLLPDSSVHPIPPLADDAAGADAARKGLLSSVLSRPEAAGDHGAEAAYRSIPRRSSPELQPALLSHSERGERERAGLLEHLAERTGGAVRGELLSAAGEQWQRAGEPARARELFEQALSHNADDLFVLRELRKQALLERDLERARELLLRELALPIAREEQALCLLLLAELELREESDLGRVERTALQSFERGPSVSAALLLYELRARQGHEHGAAEALQWAAELWPEAKAQAALWLEAGRRLLAAGAAAAALPLFERAHELDGELLDAALCCFRAAREAGDTSQTLAALVRLEQSLEVHQGTLASLLIADLQRLRARLHEARGDTLEAARSLGEARGRVNLRVRARLAEKLGDRAAQRAALEGYTRAAGGSARALALLGLAELSLAESDYEAAGRSLRQAAAADAHLSLVRTMQAAFARVPGAAAVVGQGVDQVGAEQRLEAAARLAADGSGAERELELLEGVEAQSRTASQLALDAAAELGLWERVSAALGRQSEQTAPAERLGLELALADVRGALGQPTTLAPRDAPSDSSLLWFMQKIHRTREPHALGALWLELSGNLRGEAAAAAATLAGDYFAQTGGAREAYERALAAVPGYPPACWALEPILRSRDDRPALRRVQAALARASDDPQERAARAMRIAAMEEGKPADDVASDLREAAALSPGEALLWDRGASHESARVTLTLAEILEDGGHSASGPLAGVAKLRAAALYEDAEEPARAAVLYREVLDRSQGASAHASFGLERSLTQAGLVSLLVERLERAVQEADSADMRSDVLERLALVRAGAGDDRHAAESWRALLDVDPERISALRAVQRNAMERGDLAQLALAAERLAERKHDPHERAAELRLLARARALLGQPAPRLSDSDTTLGLWHALTIERDARARKDALSLASVQLRLCAAHIADPSEQASYAMRAAEALEPVSAARAVQALERYALAVPEHTLAHETLGRLRQAEGEATRAAHAYEQAALASPTRRREARLFHRAAVLWQEAVGDDQRARRALEAVVAIDVLHRDAFARLKNLLEAANDTSALAALLTRRISAGGDARLLCNLHVERFRLLMRLGQRSDAKSALRAALKLDPQRLEALRAVAELHLQSAEWRDAAEALIRVARLTQDATILREAFMTLGSLYTEQLPDLRRAEIAYGRAVSLDPNDTGAVERLLQVFLRSGDLDKALRACDRLLDLARDEPEYDRRTVELARVLEQKGELLRAERALNDRRAQRPVSGTIIVALSELHTRQQDQRALAVHLDRSAHALRAGLLEDPTDNERWSALCDTLVRRGRTLAAQCSAAFALDLGLAEAKIEALAARFQPLARDAFAPGVLERLWTPELTPELRKLLAWLEPRAGALLPDVGQPRQLQQLPASLQQAVDSVRASIELPNPTCFAVEGRECLPLRGKVPGLLIGRELLVGCDADELAFLVLRAAAVARLQLSAAVRGEPDALDALLSAGAAPAGAVADPAHSTLGQLSARARRELHALIDASSAGAPLSARSLRAQVLRLGGRVALAALGNPSAAFAALATSAATPGAEANFEGHDLLTALARSADARALLEFALSDAYLELQSELEAQPQAD